MEEPWVDAVVGGGLGRIEIVRRSVGEEDAQQRADLEHGGDTGVERRLHALEACGPFGESARLDREVLEDRQSSSRRERIPESVPA